jgi:hypothetical protein
MIVYVISQGNVDYDVYLRPTDVDILIVGRVNLPVPTDNQQDYTLVYSDYISNAAQKLYWCSLVQSPGYYFREVNGYVPIH